MALVPRSDRESSCATGHMTGIGPVLTPSPVPGRRRGDELWYASDEAYAVADARAVHLDAGFLVDASVRAPYAAMKVGNELVWSWGTPQPDDRWRTLKRRVGGGVAGFWRSPRVGQGLNLDTGCDSRISVGSRLAESRLPMVQRMWRQLDFLADCSMLTQWSCPAPPRRTPSYGTDRPG